MLRLVKIVKDLTNVDIDREVNGGISHLILTTLIMDVLFNGNTHS